MKVRVLLFALARQLAGTGSLEIEVPGGACLSDVLADLPAWLPGARFALNEEFAGLDAPLSDGDVVAVLPPVSGG